MSSFKLASELLGAFHNTIIHRETTIFELREDTKNPRSTFAICSRLKAIRSRASAEQFAFVKIS